MSRPVDPAAVRRDVVLALLANAAQAWADGRLDDAERLAEAAWVVMDGREFVDCEGCP